MPRPNPRHDVVLKYLRHQFPYRLDFEAWDGVVHPYETVKQAVYSLRDNSPEILRILNYHMFTSLPRTRIAEEVGFDPSTIKRKLNQAADCIMQRLSHEDFPPEDLFTIRDEKSGELRHSAFPLTFPNSW